MFGRDDIRAEIADLEGRVQQERARQPGVAARARAALEQASAEALADRQAWKQALRTREWGPPATAAPWTQDAWEGWDPAEPADWSRLRVGGLWETRTGDDLGVPVTIPFVGGGRNVVVVSEVDEPSEPGAALLRSLLLRASAAVAHQTRIVLLDPTGQGGAFPMRRGLPGVADSNTDVRQDLEECLAYVRKITQNYLTSTLTSFEQLDEATRMTERFQLVFVAGFPTDYSSLDLEVLRLLSLSGPAAGTYLFLHLDKQRSDDTAPLERSLTLSPREQGLSVSGLQTTVRMDGYPPPEVERLVLRLLSSATPRDTPIGWTDLHSFDISRWWRESSAEALVAPIGRSGGTGTLDFTFGVTEDGRPCVHGLLGANTGSGKSQLFHTLVSALATRYAPDELELYLVDGKYGTEFLPYAEGLPHARVVSLRTPPTVARSVLAELKAEMGRRNEEFQRVGVTDIVGYRRMGLTMPRILLVVDEYQYLFDDDEGGAASELLADLAEQGRSAGIHFLLASQGFDVGELEQKQDVLRNVHLRVAMTITGEERDKMEEFQPEGRRLIGEHCDRPGKMVLNRSGGADGHNQVGRAALLRKSDQTQGGDLDRVLELLVQREPERAVDTVVLHGADQSHLTSFGPLRALAGEPTWPSSRRLQDLARTDVKAGGLGITDWLAAERPVGIGLGRELAVYGEVTAVLRRGRGEHVLVVGNRDLLRIAVLASCAASALACRDPDHIALHVWDRSLPDTPWHRFLADRLPALAHASAHAVVAATTAAEVTGDLDTVRRELERRRSLPEEQQMAQPSLLVVADLDRLPDLEQVLDDFGPELSDDGRALAEVLADGAALGIHLVIGVSNVRNITRVIGEARLAHFRHRVAFQMSDDDSFTLLQASDATRLATDADAADLALYADVDAGRRVVFVPPVLEVAEDEASATLPGLVECETLLRRWSGA